MAIRAKAFGHRTVISTQTDVFAAITGSKRGRG